MDKMERKYSYKYYMKLVRERTPGEEGVFEKLQNISQNGKFGLVQTIPFEDESIENYVAYSIKKEDYEIAVSVTKYKNDKKIPKEKIEIQGTKYRRDSKLIDKILGELDK